MCCPTGPPRPAYRRCYQVALHTPTVTIRPSQTPPRPANPRGIQGRTNLSDRSDWSDRSDTSATPPQHAHRRCYQVALHTPTVTLRPSQTTLRQANPRGIQGRTNLSDLSDLSDRSDTSATPTQHAHRRCHQVALHTPTVNLPVALPPAAHQRPSQTTPRPANPRGIQWRTHIPLKNSQRFPKIPKDSHTTPRPRRPQTPAAIKQAQKKRLGLCQTAVFKRAISLPPVEPATPSVPSAEFLPCREKVSFRRLRLKRRRSNQKAHSPVQRCSFHSRAA